MEFPHTIGHEKQKQMFLRAAAAGRLGHAYAFVGEEGIGKTTFALDLARALGADSVLDTAFFDSSEGLVIEEARNLRDRLSLTPVGKCKVAIVAQAEKMTVQAANSLLKILEEPPAHSLLILTILNFYSFLPTIASRLQRVNFARCSEAELREGLAREMNLDAGKLGEIALLAAGRIGLGKRLAADQELFNFLLEAKDYYLVLERGSVVERLQTAEKLARLDSPKINNMLKWIMEHWVAGEGNLRISERLKAAWKDLRWNLNTKLVLDNLFLP